MGLKLMGNKIGMTQIFNEDGSVVPVTVLRVGPCVVVDKKTASKNGYCALVLGYGDIKKEGRLRMSELGLYKKSGIEPKGRLVESRVSAEELDRYEIGQAIDISVFSKGDHVDVTGTSKGRGFTGVIKRHGMSGAKSSHGAHEYFRHGGSIGSSAAPSRVFKGMKMPGRYGGGRVTVQNLLVSDIRPEQHLLLIRGAVPGPNRSQVTVAQAVRKAAAVEAGQATKTDS